MNRSKKEGEFFLSGFLQKLGHVHICSNVEKWIVKVFEEMEVIFSIPLFDINYFVIAHVLVLLLGVNVLSTMRTKIDVPLFMRHIKERRTQYTRG